jgi:hypothetical protein
MALPLRDVNCASVPVDSLPVLADLRAGPGITVALADGRAWVRWESNDESVLRLLLPVSGVALYVFRDGNWHRFGRHLPAFDLPPSLDYRPLHQVLFPAPVLPVPSRPVRLRPLRLRLVADPRPRPTTALECTLAELARWAETVPELRLNQAWAAHCRGRVLVLGDRLPEVALGSRFWGESMLVPLGWRAEPDLPAGAVREALGLSEEELLVLDAGGAEVVPRSAFEPLTRARVRLASRWS